MSFVELGFSRVLPLPSIAGSETFGSTFTPGISCIIAVILSTTLPFPTDWAFAPWSLCLRSFFTIPQEL